MEKGAELTRARVDLINASTHFELSSIRENEVLSVETEAGDFVISLFPASPQNWPTAERARVLYSTTEGLNSGEDVRVEGASMGGSINRLGSIGQFCTLLISKLALFEIPADTEISQENFDSFVKEGTIKVIDGKSYFHIWDGEIYHTQPVLQATKITADGSVQRVFS